MKKFTNAEKKVWEYLQDVLPEGVNPTVREICAACGISSTSHVSKIIRVLCEEGLIEKSDYSSRSIRLKNMATSVSVPILGKVTAGAPILAVEEIEGYLALPSFLGERKNLFSLLVSGYSMKNAGILDGDIVIADKEKPAKEGDIVVALIEDEATVKRLRLDGSKIVLMPENEDFDPIYPESCKILGVVTGSFRRY